jgi:hypothetical protein
VSSSPRPSGEGDVLTWSRFAAERPDLASAGQQLLYQFGVGLAFLATTRADGGPRLHPMCPILVGDGLYALIIPSPKREDLHRDGRYALHSFPADDNEDAFSITGSAASVENDAVRQAIVDRFLEERRMAEHPATLPTWEPFEFLIGSILLTRTTGHGDPSPRHTMFRAAT